MWKFIKSSVDATTWLSGHKREVCFIGRSNVGKSSLINALTNIKRLAITSNTPGRTQLINFFQEKDKVLVDLPGYGYAKLSKSAKIKIETMLQEYFEHRDEIANVFVLIDTKVGLTSNDKVMIEYLQTLGHNFMIIGTKIDKANQSEVIKTTNSLKLITNAYLLTSSTTKHNIEELKLILNKFFDSP